MKTRNKIAALSLITIMCMAGTSQAADATWNGISGNWSAAGVWSSGIPASGADSTANFTGVDITAAKTITLDTARTIGNITFTDATTADSDLTIDGASVLTLDRTSGVPTINVTSRTLTISSQISGSDGLQKTGGGTLTLSGNNDYAGTTAINVGQLTISTATGLGSTAGNTTITATGSTSTGGRLNFSSGSGNNITVAENITITGTTEVSPFTSAINNNGQGTVTLSGNITLSSLTGGISLDTNNSGSNMILAGTITQTGSSQALILSPSRSGGQYITVNNPIALNGGTLQIQNLGRSILNGVNATDGTGIGQTVIVSGGNLVLGVTDALNTTSTLTVDGNFDLANFNQTVNVLSGSGYVTNSVAGTKTLTAGNGGGSGTFNGTIINGTGNIQLIKTGTGTQTLTGVNACSGPMLINEGTLEGVVGGSCANSAVTNASAGTLAISVTNNTMWWACASLTMENGSKLKFNFTGTPSPTVAPLNITSNLTFSGTTTIEVVPLKIDAYPLLTVAGTVTGTLPTLIGDKVALKWIGNTLWLTPQYGTVISIR